MGVLGRFSVALLASLALAYATVVLPGSADTVQASARPSGFSRTTTVSVFFAEKGHLVRVRARVARPALVGAMKALLAGPRRALLLGHVDRSALGTQIPHGTCLLGVRVGRRGVAKVDLTERFGSGGGSLSMRLRVAQVVYTLTQLRNVHAVRFKINHRRIVALGGEGLLLDKPVGRARFRDLLAARPSAASA